MRYCAIPGCGNYSAVVKVPNVIYFNFPSNPDVLKKWLSACGRAEAKQTNFICSDHFELSCFVEVPVAELELNPIVFKKVLKDDAVPTLNLYKKSHRQKKVQNSLTNNNVEVTQQIIVDPIDTCLESQISYFVIKSNKKSTTPTGLENEIDTNTSSSASDVAIPERAQFQPDYSTNSWIIKSEENVILDPVSVQGFPETQTNFSKDLRRIKCENEIMSNSLPPTPVVSLQGYPVAWVLNTSMPAVKTNPLQLKIAHIKRKIDEVEPEEDFAKLLPRR